MFGEIEVTFPDGSEEDLKADYGVPELSITAEVISILLRRCDGTRSVRLVFKGLREFNIVGESLIHAKSDDLGFMYIGTYDATDEWILFGVGLDFADLTVRCDTLEVLVSTGGPWVRV
jgi:hypothetical protein